MDQTVPRSFLFQMPNMRLNYARAVAAMLVQQHAYTLRPANDETEGSTQEANMGASCVLPRKVGELV